jgi:hypothetical protein
MGAQPHRNPATARYIPAQRRGRHRADGSGAPTSIGSAAPGPAPTARCQARCLRAPSAMPRTGGAGKVIVQAATLLVHEGVKGAVVHIVAAHVAVQLAVAHVEGCRGTRTRPVSGLRAARAHSTLLYQADARGRAGDGAGGPRRQHSPGTYTAGTPPRVPRTPGRSCTVAAGTGEAGAREVSAHVPGGSHPASVPAYTERLARGRIGRERVADHQTHIAQTRRVVQHDARMRACGGRAHFSTHTHATPRRRRR